jgi:predicted PurR-regulated permease PerM
VQVVLVVFTMYYLFRDGERVKRALHEVLPLEWEQSHAIFVRTHEVISASVYGVVVIAAIQGILGGLTFWALQLPSPLMWGAVMVLLSMIPVVGSTIVWVPTAIYLILSGSWIRGVILIAVGAGVIAMVDNLLRPRLVGGRTRLHELLVFFSVLGGLQVFGILGIVVGPVVVAITLALLDVFRQVQRPAAITVAEPTLIEEQAALRDVPPEPGPRESHADHHRKHEEHAKEVERDVQKTDGRDVTVEQAVK